jgi:hypothetical protein
MHSSEYRLNIWITKVSVACTNPIFSVYTAILCFLAKDEEELKNCLMVFRIHSLQKELVICEKFF